MLALGALPCFLIAVLVQILFDGLLLGDGFTKLNDLVQVATDESTISAQVEVLVKDGYISYSGVAASSFAVGGTRKPGWCRAVCENAHPPGVVWPRRFGVGAAIALEFLVNGFELPEIGSMRFWTVIVRAVIALSLIVPYFLQWRRAPGRKP